MDRRRKVDIPKEAMGLVIGKKHSNRIRIQEKTGAKIEIIDNEIYVSGEQQQCEHAIRELKASAIISKSKVAPFPFVYSKAKSLEGKTKVGIPKHVIGLVIGKKRSNLNRIQEQTGAEIDAINDQIYVSGGQLECKKAIKKLKSSAYVGLYKNVTKKQRSHDTYDFVDGTGQVCEYKLHPQEEFPRPDWYQGFEHFRIERIGEQDEEYNGGIEIDDLKNFMRKVLQKIQDGSDEGEKPKAGCWYHFGEICVTRIVDEDDVRKVYSLADLQNHFNGKDGWKMIFEHSIKNMKVKSLEGALSECESEEIPSHIRYDLCFLTPTCSRVRVKFFVDFSGKPLNHVEFVKQFTDLKECCSSTQHYAFCEHFSERGKVSIAIPSRSMDVLILIPTALSSDDMKEKEYEETLKQYLDNIVFSENGDIQLPDDNEMPDDFVLKLLRKSTRRFYSYDVTEEDSFTIVIYDE